MPTNWRASFTLFTAPRFRWQTRFLTLLLLLCALPVFAAPEKPRPKKILLLLSDPAQINEYVNVLDSAIRARVPGDVQFVQADVGVDESELTKPYSNSVAEAFRSRFEHAQLDLVIAVGRGALVFLIQYHEKVFPGVPILFTGVGTQRFGGKTWPGMTGLTAPVPVAETVDLALQLQPKTETIALVADPANPFWVKAAQSEIARHRDRVKEIDIIEPAGPEVLNKVDALPPRTVVLLTMGSLTASGTPRLAGPDLIDAIAQRAPTYSPWHTLCEHHECVGGVYDDGGKELAWVTETAVRILSGEKLENIPIKNSTDVRVTVDWRALQRWGISERNLPPGSTVLNRPPSPWELYKGYIFGALFLIALEALLIFGLLLYMARAQKAEAELSQNQRRLAGLIETALDAIVAVDERQRILLFNAAAERIFGCPAASAIGSTLDRFIPQRFRAAHGAHIRRFGETGITSRNMGVLDNLSGLRSTGEEFPIEASISQVQTSGKKLYTVMIRDITKRKQAEEELQREKAFTEAVIDSLPDIFFVIKTTGAFLHWGRNPERILGYSTEDTLAMSQAVEIVAEEDRAAATRAIEEAFASGSVTVEVQLLHKDGRKIPYLLRATRALIGSEYLLVGIGLNITERKQTEEALMQSEARFRTIFEESAMGIILMDLTGHPLQTNPAFQRMIGYSENELHAMSFTDFTHPDHRENDWQVFCELLEDKLQSIYQIEKRYVRKDGQIVWARLTLSLIKDIQGQPQYTVAMVQDITESRQAEEALRDSEAQLREAQHVAGLGSSIWDVTTDTTVWSPEMYQIMGFDASQPPPGHADRSRVYTPDSWARLSHAVERALVAQEPYDLEVQFMRGDGTVRWGHAQGTPVCDDHGRVIRLSGTLQDITERKLVAERIKASEEEYLLLLNSTAEGIFGIDMNGACTFCNPAALRILGYARSEELLGTDMHQRLHHSYADGSPYPVDRCPIRTSVLEGKGSHVDDEVMWRKDGSSFLAEYWSHPVFKAGKAAGGVITFLDISDRRRAEGAMVRLRQAVDASGEVVFMTDHEGVITFVNPEFTRLYGYSEEEVIGKVPRRVLRSDDVSEADYERIWQAAVTMGSAHDEIVNTTKSGRKVTIERSTSAVRDKHGDITGFISIQRDITLRKRLEQQLMQAQKMEAVGQLAGGVAHDFNNILGIITGYTELALDDTTLAERPRQRLAEIRNAANRAVEITRQLLAFSRKQVLETRILNLNEIVQETTRLLGRLLGEDIEVAIVLDPNLGSVRADPTGIDQIILNLAVNARDAMPNGGKLTIETANVTVDDDSSTRHGTLTAGDYVVLTVSDTGVGMDAETQERIFEPFYTTKEKGRGTGLGLSTVFGIVEQNGGSIWTYSELGSGTTFKIYLPRVAAAGPNVTHETTEMIRGGGETILFAEDDSGLRKLNVELLRDLGYNVIEAIDGAEALSIVERYPDQLDLLLTDVVMPGMNGQQLAEEALRKRPTLKVLFVSGYTSGAVREKIMASGAPFLQKPLSRKILAKTLREILDSTDTGAVEADAARKDA